MSTSGEKTHTREAVTNGSTWDAQMAILMRAERAEAQVAALKRDLAAVAAVVRQEVTDEILDLLTAHELYRYRPKAFDGFIEYVRAALATPAEGERT